jgi:hypothetical protein
MYERLMNNRRNALYSSDPTSGIISRNIQLIDGEYSGDVVLIIILNLSQAASLA